MGGKSWRDAYEGYLQAARASIGGDPDIVLFTGGASRMRFVIEVAAAVFPGSKVLSGKAPELAIAMGLAWFGRIKLRSTAFTKDVEALCASPAGQQSKVVKIIQDELPALLDGLAPVLARRIADEVVIPAAKRWRNGKIDTLRDFERQTETDASAWIASSRGRQVIAEISKVWLPRVTRKLEVLTDPICDRYKIPHHALAIEATTHVSGDVLSRSAVTQISLDHLEGFATVINLITAVVVGTLLGGAKTALLMSGPVGWFIGFVGAAVVLFLGWEVAKDAIKDVNIPTLARKTLFSESRLIDKVHGGLDDMARKMRADLAEKTSDQLSKAIESQIRLAILSRAQDALVRLS